LQGTRCFRAHALRSGAEPFGFRGSGSRYLHRPRPNLRLRGRLPSLQPSRAVSPYSCPSRSSACAVVRTTPRSVVWQPCDSPNAGPTRILVVRRAARVARIPGTAKEGDPLRKWLPPTTPLSCAAAQACNPQQKCGHHVIVARLVQDSALLHDVCLAFRATPMLRIDCALSMEEQLAKSGRRLEAGRGSENMVRRVAPHAAYFIQPVPRASSPRLCPFLDAVEQSPTGE